MTHKTRKDGLIVDSSNNGLVAIPIDSFVTALGEGPQADLVILRLYRQEWTKEGPIVPAHRLHQFALPSHRAAELGRQLLEYAAQAEKESKGGRAH